MNYDQTNTLQAALERAAATMRNSGSNVGSGSGLFAPSAFGGPGMFNPTPMANQSQPGMQPTPNAQVADRFGGMAPPTQTTPNQYVAQNFPQGQQAMAQMSQPHPAAAPSPSVNPNGSIPGAQGPTSVGGAPLQPQQPQPQQPQPQPTMGFFQRNAAMMRDPSTGAFIDPQGATRAQASQPQGIIPNMMGLFGGGTPSTNPNGSIQGAYGPTSVGGAPLQQAPQNQDQGGLIQRMLGYLGSKQG